jgi:hypothetical protein
MNNNREQNERNMGMTGKGTGMQGVDKAPGEETASSPDQFVQETQKGKNKVDGDPSKESDQPIDQP